MNGKLTALLITLILLLAITNLTVMSRQSEPENTTISLNKGTIYVDDDNKEGPWMGTWEYPYQYIHDGVLNAEEWDIVYVFNGLYSETLTIDKPIILQGENQSDTIIDGTYEECIINIICDYASITNFTIKNSGGYRGNAGIKISSDNSSISDCTIYRTKTGIYVEGRNNCKIYNCTFHTNGEGIYLKSTHDSKVGDCLFYHNGFGMNLQSSDEIKIIDCYTHTNGIGLILNNSSNIEILHCAIYNNNDNQGGIFIHGCSQIDIASCNIRHNGFAVDIKNSSSIKVTYSDLHWNTHVAVDLAKSLDNISISHCDIAHNFRYAIHATDSPLVLTNNNIYENNLYGLHTKNSLCNARHNWWGYATGPALTGFGPADRITRDTGQVSYVPWSTKPLESVGSDWDIIDVETKPIVAIKHFYFTSNDSDNDSVPDWWEEKWGYSPLVWDDHVHLDPDGDGLNNIEECFTDQYDSNPFHIDIFLEFDWVKSEDPMVTNEPPIELIDEMKSRFEEHNITLHVDTDSLGGGEEIPTITGFSLDELRDLYWDYFLHNDLDNPRKGIFHYGLICDYGPGPGFAFVGWDNLDSFIISAQQLADGNPSFSRGQLIMTGSMHETGHTLGLFVDDFGGNDNRNAVQPKYKEFWLYRNYKSCMNYRYTWMILDYSDGTHGYGDFDDWSNLDFTFFKNTHFEWPKETS